MRTTALAALAVALVACVDPPPQLAPPAPAARSTTSVARPLPTKAAQASATAPDGWQHVAQQLETENRQLTTERDYWKAEAEKQHAGWQAATTRLNEMAAALGRAEGRAAAVTAIGTAPPARAHVVAPTPQVQVYIDSVLVVGTLYNHGAAPARGEYAIELLVNGGLAESRTFALEIPARAQVPFSHPFKLHGSGNYFARVLIRAL